MLLLGIIICLTGALIALLPPFPESMKYWSLLAVLAALYPLSLYRKFRQNRADYEFRLLHWYPFFMLCLWLVLAIFDPRGSAFHILFLGFFVLWSLPLSLLGLILLGLFAFHVIRRRTLRLSLLSIVAAVFIAGSISTEAMGLHQKLSAALFPPSGARHVVGNFFTAMRSLVDGQAERPRINSNRTDPLKPLVTSASSQSSTASSLAPAILQRRPRRLVRSGPEDFILLAVGLMGLYAAVLHNRARRRT